MVPYETIQDHTGPYRTIGVHISSNRRGIVKESQIDLSVREGVREGGCEGGREGGNLWGIEVLTHLKTP